MAITTILVGCDLSDSSNDAVDRAVALAVQHGAKLVLVHAQADDAPLSEGTVDNAMLEQLGEVSAAVRVEEAKRLADLLAAIEAKNVRVELVSRIGPADEVLVAASVEYAAELIVVGTHGHTGISRFLLGSVAAATIRRATCDVLVVRGSQPAPFHRPLIATDFSPLSSKAIAHAALVCAPDATLDVIHAWQLPVGSWGATLLGEARFPWSTVRDAVLTSARTQAGKLVAEHAGLGRTIQVELVQGSPSQVITHAAEQTGHDLIAIGAHGRRGVRRLLLGSVAEGTVRHSPCSVLIVHG